MCTLHFVRRTRREHASPAPSLPHSPDDTPWEDGTFRLQLEFTEDYPNKAPTVKFVTRLFHPNVYADGSICLDILQNQWSPIYDISAILTSIQSLLCDPNPNSPANSEAARLYQVRALAPNSIWTAQSICTCLHTVENA